MRVSDTIIIDGRAYSWRALLEARRRQIEQWKKARPAQPTLFELKENRRPESQRTAGECYRQPSLRSCMNDAGG